MSESKNRPPAPERIFTLEEANAMIPMFAEWLHEIQVLKQAIVNIIESKAEMTKGNGHYHTDSVQTKHDLGTTADAVGRITELVTRINQTGAELKDLDLGLVDFPYQRGAKIVYLCWILGEKTITHWHTLDSGVGGRQPL